MLSLVATPIGNSNDISPRALSTLRQAHLIACEDTRVAQQRLHAWGIEGKTLRSYWDQNEQARVPELIERLHAGEHIALISDAGMPLISDPGYRIVEACVREGLAVEVLPGPCAVVTALAGSGLATDRFYFGGFLPRDAGPRRSTLESLADLRATLIFYESPQRLSETLAVLATLWPNRQVCAARNLTGPYQQWLRGFPAAVRAELGDETRGEVTLLIAGAPDQVQAPADLDAQLDALLKEGRPLKEIRDLVAEMSGLPKREIYARLLARSGR